MDVDAVTPERPGRPWREGRPQKLEPLAPETRRIYRQRRDQAHERLRTCARRVLYARHEGAAAEQQAMLTAKLAYQDYLSLCHRLNDDDRARGMVLIGDTVE